MRANQSVGRRRHVDTPSGRISYSEAGNDSGGGIAQIFAELNQELRAHWLAKPA